MKRAVQSTRASANCALTAALVVAASVAVAAPPAQTEIAPATAPAPAEGNDPARRALIAAGDPPDLFLLYTGDVIGYVDSCG